MSVESDTPQHAAKLAFQRLIFTALFLAVMLFANLRAGSLYHGLPAPVLADWGIGHDTLLRGEVFRLFTGIFLSHDPQMVLRQMLFAAVVIGYTEWRRGTLQAALLFIGLAITTTLMLLVSVNLGAGIIDLTGMNDVGMSMGGFGLIGLAFSDWRGKWLLLAAAVLGIDAKFNIAPDVLADGGHLLALLSGFALGHFAPCPAKVRLERGKKCAKKAT